MRKNKSEIYLANMSISLYRDGDEAMTEVKNLEAMNSRVGKTGMFSESTPLTIERLKVYFVTGQPELGLYHYFYAKDKEVFWIQVDNPDESYRLNFVREAIKRV